jgi:uridine kinase
MRTKNKPGFVIGISSVSGGGKTAVTKKLTELLQDAVMLCFDDYDETTVHPEDLHTWFTAGADYNVWKTPGLTSDLLSLATGNYVTSPLDGSNIQTAKYIVFDAPLGRAHSDTGKFIDFMVFIDTPLDIAMARRIMRDINTQTEKGAENAVKYLNAHLSSYLNGGQLLFLELEKQIKSNCDIVLDGRLTVDELAAAICLRLGQLSPI